MYSSTRKDGNGNDSLMYRCEPSVLDLAMLESNQAVKIMGKLMQKYGGPADQAHDLAYVDMADIPWTSDDQKADDEKADDQAEDLADDEKADDHAKDLADDHKADDKKGE